MKRSLLLTVAFLPIFLLAACAPTGAASSGPASKLTYGLAFIAGLASFLSPCVLSLVPAYIGYLGGRAAGGEVDSSRRWVTFAHGLAFVLGFTVVFILFNILASAVGSLLVNLRFWLEKIGGLIVIIFGLHMIGVFHLRFLEYDLRVHNNPVNQRLGYISSFLMGIFFSAGWSPCVGPVLSAIVMLSINGGNILYGAMLGLVYSAGLAIPFLVAALGIGWVTTILRRYNKVMHITEIVMGVILVAVGLLLLFGKFNLIATLFPTVNLGL